MPENTDSTDYRWQGLHNKRIELALLQVDIVSHSTIPATEADKLTFKLLFGDTVKRVAIAHGGKCFKWAGDGGSFMFLTAGDGFNELVTAAVEISDGMPELNEKILRETELTEPLRVRISCHSGLATYREEADQISGDFVNDFLKHERAVGFPGAVCITESVHQQLRASLQNQFQWKKHSAELGCAIYELKAAEGTDTANVKPIKRLPDWTLFVAPGLGIVLAFVLRMHPLFVALEVMVVILINLSISRRIAKSDSTEDQDFVHTLRKNDLLAPKGGRPLVFQAKIVIVEDAAQEGSFINRIDLDYKTADESKDSNLILIPFTCRDSQQEANERTLRLTLEGANAVVVVWSKELRQKSWVYKTIDSWAFQRSDVPILFALNDGKVPKPDRYLYIPADSKSLPWRLLQRGNERARDWRGAAAFNRIMVGNALILLAMVVLVGALQIHRQRTATQAATGDLFSGLAFNVKDQFLNTVVIKKPETLAPTSLQKEDFDISFWFSECGEVRQFGSTERTSHYMRFDVNQLSAIGGAWVYGTCVSDARLGSPMRIWNNADEEITDHSAQMHEEQNKNRKLVVCASHSTDPSEEKTTVGICIFTNKDHVTVDERTYRQTLRNKARELFDRASTYVAHRELAPLPEKPGTLKPRRLYRCLL